MKIKVSMPAVRELIDDIEAYKRPLDKMKDDSRIKRRVTSLMTILEA
jgi:hypothetical protein